VVCVVVALALGAIGWVVTLVTKSTKDSITRMDVAVVVARDGSLTVTQSFDVHYSTAKHGPYLTFTNLQATATAGRYRELAYVVDSVTSPTGAPAAFTTTSSPADGTVIQIGSASTTVTGTQTYVVAYRVTGVMNPRVASSGSDELFWNVIGTGWTLPMSNVQVTVASDATVSATACWQGQDFTTPCTAHASAAGTATYTQSSLAVGEGMAIVAGWPGGTFTGAEPTYVTRPIPPPPFELTPLKGALTGGGLVLVVLLGLGLWWRSRDRLYVGLTPGNLPVAGEPAPLTRKASDVPYAVRFTPPDGVTPGTVGTLVDKKADLRDVTATLVDLAVRGMVRIEKLSGDDIQVVRRAAPSDDLAPYEATLLKGLFTKKRSVADTEELQGSRFGKAVSATRRQLYEAVVTAGWFVRSPEHDGSLLVAAAIALGIVATFGTFIAAMTGWGLVMIPLLLLCVLLVVATRWTAGRTAVGAAALSQTLGFKQYLETAEADQITWEEGEDIFSRYLPYAIAFGCADHWAGVFAELVDTGASVPMPSWYVADGLLPLDLFGRAGVASLVGSFGTLETSFGTGVAASTVGSSGGSGFSGGGFAGGGIGGGGGGTW
jgi:uncharacterized membrane protein YgcG